MVQRYTVEQLLVSSKFGQKSYLVDADDYAALEQRFNALSTKFSALVDENATLRKRREDAEQERDELLQELGNLLAIIHRDGGHYMSKHGVKKAIEDAHTIWAGRSSR